MAAAKASAVEAPILRLPAEILQEMVKYAHDPVALCHFVGSCRQTYNYIGKDFVHLQCSKAWGAKQFNDTEPSFSTLEAAARQCSDMDVLNWILDMYVVNFPSCLARIYNDGSAGNTILHAAVRSRNTAAVQLLLDRGAEVPLPSDGRYQNVYEKWILHECSLSKALMNKNFPSGIWRLLLNAGHAATCDHVARAVEKNDPEVVEAVLTRAFELEDQRQYNWLCPVGDAPLLRAFRKGRDGDMRVLELLIGASLRIKEKPKCLPVNESHPGPHREPRDPKAREEYPRMSFPVGYAIKQKCPQKALLVLRNQVLQGLDTPALMNDIITQVCTLYTIDQSRPSGKSPQYHTTCAEFIKGFHPEFTSRLIDSRRCKGSEREREEQKFRLGCDRLLFGMVMTMGPSHDVVKYLLANGCRMTAGLISEEIVYWRESTHCLIRKYDQADAELCKKCEPKLGKKYPTLRARVSRLDALLTRADPALLNEPIRLSNFPGSVDEVTFLSHAVTLGLWILAYRLIHHGADVSSLNNRAKASIRELYRETFSNNSHPLVVAARAGKFVPDKKVFTRGLKGDEEEQALTLVMLTIGLPSGT